MVVPQEVCPRGSMVAFPEKKFSIMRKEVRNEILRAFEVELKKMVQDLLERLMREEREIYLENPPTKANGYCQPRPPYLRRPLADLKVPRVREGDLHPQILPYRKRASLERSLTILTLYAVGVSTREISAFLEGVYGTFYSPQSISRLIEVTQEQVKAWRERLLSAERCFWTGLFSPSVEGKPPRNPCTWLSESNPMDEGRSSGFGSSAQKGRAPGIGKKSSRTSGGVGCKGYGSSSPMTFQAWRRRSRRAFPRESLSFVFCTQCRMHSIKRGRRTGKRC